MRNQAVSSPRSTFLFDAARRFTTKFCLASGLLVALYAFSPVFAQSQRTETGQTSALPVVAAATSRGARYVAPYSVVEMRLEVFSSTGEKVFDSTFRRGSVLDWDASGKEQPGKHVPDDSYLCVVTFKDLTGNLAQRHGLATVQAGNVTLRAAAREELLGPQAQAWAASREAQSLASLPQDGENVALSIVSEQEAQAMTVTAHDEQAGQVTSTTGALSFRTGDLFAGKDVERVRITEEGRVGIGTSKPAATLDVAGTIRASGALYAAGGVEFSDGSRLSSALGKLVRTDTGGQTQVPVDGVGTTGRLTKWANGPAGTLSDSLLEEAGQNLIHRGQSVQLTGAASSLIDTNLIYLDATNKTTGVLAGNVPSFGAVNGPYFAMRGNTYTAIPNQRGIFAISAGLVSAPGPLEGSVRFVTGNDVLSLFLKHDGNVGVGTTDPLAKLDIAGNVKLTGVGNGITFPDGTIQTTGGATGTGTTNTVPLWTSAAALGNSVITQSGGSVGIGVAVPSQKLDVAGNIKASGSLSAASATITGSLTAGGDLLDVDTGAGQVSVEGTLIVDDSITTLQYNIGADRVLSVPGTENVFVGVAAGDANGIGANNSFFGRSAGMSNTIGNDNSFFGRRAGATNLGGDSNSFFGKDAGAANTADNNSFFGALAGAATTTGGNNSFFGERAGSANSIGLNNAFFGSNAGTANTTGLDNAFFGRSAGSANTFGFKNAFFGWSAGSAHTEGDNNTFVGAEAGQSNTTENDNTFIGAKSNGFEGITNATAIGANASVLQSDSLVLGNGVKVGIGTSTPKEKLHVGGGNVLIDGAGDGLILKSPDGLTCAKLTIDNAGALVTTVIPCP